MCSRKGLAPLAAWALVHSEYRKEYHGMLFSLSFATMPLSASNFRFSLWICKA